MEVANTLAYYDTATISAVRSFTVQAPGWTLIAVKNGLEMKRHEVLMKGKFLLRSYLTFIIAFIMFEMIEEEQIGKAIVSLLSCILKSSEFNFF